MNQHTNGLDFTDRLVYPAGEPGLEVLVKENKRGADIVKGRKWNNKRVEAHAVRARARGYTLLSEMNCEVDTLGRVRIETEDLEIDAAEEADGAKYFRTKETMNRIFATKVAEQCMYDGTPQPTCRYFKFAHEKRGHGVDIVHFKDIRPEDPPATMTYEQMLKLVKQYDQRNLRREIAAEAKAAKPAKVVTKTLKKTPSKLATKVAAKTVAKASASSKKAPAAKAATKTVAAKATTTRSNRYAGTATRKTAAARERVTA